MPEHYMRQSGYDALHRHFYVCACGYGNTVTMADPYDAADAHLLAIELNHADFREHLRDVEVSVG